jgi:hypothetical protein
VIEGPIWAEMLFVQFGPLGTDLMEFSVRQEDEVDVVLNPTTGIAFVY